MKRLFSITICIAIALFAVNGLSAVSAKIRIFIVSSYSPEYLWSQHTSEGVNTGLLDFKFLDNKEQVEEFVKNGYIETDRVVIKKEWMDSKIKHSAMDFAKATTSITEEINGFKPDIIMLGDDNAANYIGNQFVDTDIPVVFWGINGSPMKYGLIESMEKPGHNVTGIYQIGYAKECLEYLKKIAPNVRTIAVLSDASETGRSKAKNAIRAIYEDSASFKLAGLVVTDSFDEWKAKALDLQEKADAFFVVNHNTLKDTSGRIVGQMEAGKWYLNNIKKPECADEKQFAEEGMLIIVDDSGFKQGYEAVRYANLILNKKVMAGDLPVIAPSRGAVIVNRQRAKVLGIDLTDKSFIEEFIDRTKALEE